MMIRGLHFTAWYRDMSNYHPALPMKRMQMVDDITDMEGTALIWSCVGSAGIGLPFLEREIYEQPPARLRIYGYLSDKEFCEECAKRNITVYGALWKAHLWEFPAEFNDDETELLSLNITRGVGKKGWVGIRELSQDRYPALFSSMKGFFPDGLRTSTGEEIIDYLAGLKSETLEGRDIYARWLMVPDHEHVCYLPCANKPAYTQYMEKAIDMMVDAGVGGVFIDEPETQLIAMRSSGCFCEECRAQFRAYLHDYPTDESVDLDLTTLDYREFLLARGVRDADLVLTAGAKRWEIPLLRSWTAFQLAASVQNVAAYSAHARDYSQKTRGRVISVTANIFDASALGLRYIQCLDVVSGEKPDLGVRNDQWYRYAHAIAGGKPTVFTNAPNEYIARISDDMRAGKPHAYLLTVLEAYAQGCNMSVGYGGWLIHLRKDAIWVPKVLADQLGRWLKDNEAFFPANPVSDTAVLYDHYVAWHEEQFDGIYTYAPGTAGERTAHQNVKQLGAMLCHAHQLYRVEIVSEYDPLTPERLSSYKNVILADCYLMPESDCRIVQQWIDGGGRALVVGKAPKVLTEAATAAVYDNADVLAWAKASAQRVIVDGSQDVALAVHGISDGYAIHLVNYNMNTQTRWVERVPVMTLTLDFGATLAAVIPFPDEGVEASLDGNILTVRNLGLYTILQLTAT